MTKKEFKDLLDMFDGYGLVITDNDLIDERIKELDNKYDVFDDGDIEDE